LEAVAFVERWVLETAQELGADIGGCLFTTGRGATSNLWARIRAAVLNRPVTTPEVAECAKGAAVVAASRTIYPNLTAAGRAMCRGGTTTPVDSALAAAYEDIYHRFRAECRSRFACS